MAQATAARPYAKAAFSIAQKTNQLREWARFLETARDLIQIRSVQEAIKNPMIPKVQKLDLLIDLLGEMSEPQKNFLMLLALYRRLFLFSDIAPIFDAYYREAKQIAAVLAVSAYPLSVEQEAQLKNALQRKLDKKIELSLRVDASILGGVILTVGDRVLDGSLKRRLMELHQQLRGK
ncbi:MAG: ATP synthase F1 subunit delta [Gammaproteobacteria bacterium GWF2_41_13]|nr:MAG: ATP synthase F1 subunit delta [Gammaproteobacteria bacterium GWF2_41_13]